MLNNNITLNHLGWRIDWNQKNICALNKNGLIEKCIEQVNENKLKIYVIWNLYVGWNIVAKRKKFDDFFKTMPKNRPKKP